MAELSRKIDKCKKFVPRNVQVNILLTEEEVTKLDSEALKRQLENPGLRYSRGALVRDILLRFLNKNYSESKDEFELSDLNKE